MASEPGSRVPLRKLRTTDRLIDQKQKSTSFTARAFLFNKFQILEKPTYQVVNTDTDADEQSDRGDDQPRDDELEFLISILIRRRKLILRKIWRRSIHGLSLTFKVQSSKLLRQRA